MAPEDALEAARLYFRQIKSGNAPFAPEVMRKEIDSHLRIAAGLSKLDPVPYELLDEKGVASRDVMQEQYNRAFRHYDNPAFHEKPTTILNSLNSANVVLLDKARRILRR